ncbi:MULTISPECIES: DeoR/GlpR family DNA-binding transcription regulator [unclassified Thalassospira]|uniref:DeoR/GlpR family DNA-binding transcription regulator n=1 Tax=unclassified Thalassospira TaxID=2648997 RepID=UPI000EBCF123|nr:MULTISPECIES: DeoR/GlpR family DNA-binding transcription regulator [unclassified Thalassospira]HAI30464.1 DeoR family transcriptional regulator [Thalassospira sp.]|tara:strand:+ start:8833 stop:9594 length:762 start_codon:yes stop_codon:yes gene_type:complete
MKRDDRRQQILDALVRDGAVQLDELAETFGVSKMTIHRDFDDLESEGLLRRTRGGATIEPGSQFESDFRFRNLQGHELKERMARAALEWVEPGMTVMINDGSTAAVLGAMLPEKRPLTVITNNDAVMETLKAEPGITVIALGGKYSAKYNAWVGRVTEETLGSLRADIAFISTPAAGDGHVYHMDDDITRTKRRMMDGATRSVLLINHLRFDHTALHVLAPFFEFSAVITDAEPSEKASLQLSEAGIKLVIAN